MPDSSTHIMKTALITGINPEFMLEPGQQVVAVDPAYYRPTEVDLLIGDANKARTVYGICEVCE